MLTRGLSPRLAGRALWASHRGMATVTAGGVRVEKSPEEVADSDMLGYSVTLRASNVFATVTDCTPLFLYLSDARWGMNAASASVFGDLLAATTCASHMTGVEVLRASVKGDGPTGKAWVFWQDRGCTGYVKNPRFDDAGGDPGALMGRGALTVQHPKLSAHRLQAPFDGDVGAAWQAFYDAHFGVPSLVRTQTRPAGADGEPFCGGVTFHVFEPPLADAEARRRAQTEQVEDLRAALDDRVAAAGGLDRASLWDEDQVLALLRDACGLTRGDVEHSAAQPVHFYCPCSRSHVLEERLRHAKQLRRDVWQLMQQDSFKLACPSCGEQHRYTPTDVRAAAGKAKQARLQASLRASRDYQAAWAVEAAKDDAFASELAQGLELDAPLSFEDVLGGGGAGSGRRRGLPTHTASYSPR